MKQLIIFLVFTVFCCTTNIKAHPAADACSYFKTTKSDDEAAFFDIFVPLFTKLRNTEQISSASLYTHLTLMQNLASNFKGNAKRHAQVLIKWVETNPKLLPRPKATPSLSSGRSTTGSPHFVKIPPVQAKRKVLDPSLMPSPKKVVKTPRKPRIEVTEEPKDRHAESDDTENKHELESTIAYLRARKDLVQAKKALDLWTTFYNRFRKNQHDLAAQIIPKMRTIEVSITNHMHEYASKELRLPNAQSLYQTRNSIQRLIAEMKRLLKIKIRKPNTQAPESGKPALRVEIPAPRSVPASPHPTPKTGRSEVPKLPLASVRTPKPALKKPSPETTPSDAPRVPHKTHFKSDAQVIPVTARFTFNAYWKDYLDGTETLCPYRAERFKRDSLGKWNDDALVPLKNIIGSPADGSGAMSFQDAENCHCWIQWAFPTMRPSDYNPYAATSNVTVLRALEENFELGNGLLYALRYFLGFMGLKYHTTTTENPLFAKSRHIIFKQRDDYQVRMNNILKNPHNFQRITRVITSLREHFLNNYATAFCSYLTNTLPELDAQFKHATQASKHYWIQAANVHQP